MRRLVLMGVALIVGVAATIAGEQSPSAGMTTPTDSASVATATVLGSMMKEQIETFRRHGIDINDAVFLDAFAKQFAGHSTGMTVQEADAYMTERFKALEEAGRHKIDKNAQQAFVDSMSVADGVVVTPSGLIFQVITEGEGVSPTDNDVAVVAYTGRLSDGTEFDGSHGELVEFPVNVMIPGFTEGLKMMKPGGEYRLVIPSSLGYGPNGMGPIPGDAVLDFTVKLEGVKGN